MSETPWISPLHIGFYHCLSPKMGVPIVFIHFSLGFPSINQPDQPAIGVPKMSVCTPKSLLRLQNWWIPLPSQNSSRISQTPNFCHHRPRNARYDELHNAKPVLITKDLGFFSFGGCLLLWQVTHGENDDQSWSNMNKHGYPAWWTNIAMENHHAINGKIHYKWPFSIAMLVHQRVCTLKETHVKLEMGTFKMKHPRTRYSMIFWLLSVWNHFDVINFDTDP
jgi:hypothetical protein